MAYALGDKVTISVLSDRAGRVIGLVGGEPAAYRVRYEVGTDDHSLDALYFEDELVVTKEPVQAQPSSGGSS